MQGMSLEQEEEISSEHALFSWEEEVVFANDLSTSKALQV